MIAYLDSSILLRVVFGEATRFAEWNQFDRLVGSELLQVECLRTIDRMRVRLPLEDAEVSRRIGLTFEILRAVELLSLSTAVLERASQPFPTTLGTLDSIHLSSALLWQQSEGESLDAFLTHDLELGRAAQAVGLTVRGL
jgi:predicted nucleic acid-binding protein